MLTIPTSWKIGTRDTWLNTIGTPVIFMRISALAETIRLSTKGCMFTEEGGSSYYYDDRWLAGISNIDTGLNFLNGAPGATGYVNQMTIRLNDGMVDENWFHDIYDLNAMLNCIIDVWLCFDEVTPSHDNSLKQYRGRIINYNTTSGQIELVVIDYTETKQTWIPTRYIDLVNKYGTGWNLYGLRKNDIIPVVFGNTYVKLVVCDLPQSVHKRQVKFCLGYPITLNANHSFYYLSETKKKLYGLTPTLAIEQGYPSYATRTMYIDDLWNLPTDARGDINILPYHIQIMNNYASGVKEGMIDKDISTCEQGVFTAMMTAVPWVFHNNLTAGFLTYWRWHIKGADIPENIIYNAYVVCDLLYVGSDSETVKGTMRIMPDPTNWSTAQTTPSWWDVAMSGSGGAVGLGWLSIMPAYATHVFYARNIVSGAEQLTLCEHKDKTYVPNLFGIDIQFRKDDTGAYARYYHIHELYLLILPVTPLIEYYAKGDFGWAQIQEAIGMIFNYFIGLDATSNLTFVNMARNYDVDGQLTERVYTFDCLASLANQFGLILHYEADGKTRIIDFNGMAADYIITNDDVLGNDDGTLQLTHTKKDIDLYSRFAIDYDYKPQFEKFDKTCYIDKDNHNLTYISATELQALCTQAFNFGSDKQLLLQCRQIGDTLTAEEVLAKCVKLFTVPIDIIKFNTSFRNIDLQLGDQIRFATSDYNSYTTNFFVSKKTINYDTMTISYDAFRSPFSTAQRMGDKVNKAIKKEKESMNELACYYLEEV